MNVLMEDIMRIVLIGIGATAVMGAWLRLLKRMNVPALNFAFLGRWGGHWRQGKWKHVRWQKRRLPGASWCWAGWSTI